MESSVIGITLTGTQSLLALALICLVVLIALWAVTRLVRAVPPALTVPGKPSGVGGILLLIIAALMAKDVTALYQFGHGIGEAARVIALDASYAWPALQTLIPEFVSSAALSAAIVALVFGRSPAALYFAVLSIWIGGPAAYVLRGPFQGLPVEFSMSLGWNSALMVVLTLFLLFSRRSNLTYGTAAGRRFAARRAAASEYGDR